MKTALYFQGRNFSSKLPPPQHNFTSASLWCTSFKSTIPANRAQLVYTRRDLSPPHNFTSSQHIGKIVLALSDYLIALPSLLDAAISET